MKISQFKVKGLIKKVKVVNGKMEIEEINQDMNGEFEVYEVDGEKFDTIRDLMKDNEDITAEQVLYHVIPIVTNIENDISEEEFALMLGNASESLLSLLAIVGEQINLIKNMAESTIKVNELVEESQPVEINKDELLRDLYVELAENTSDIEKTKEILEKINKLINE